MLDMPDDQTPQDRFGFVEFALKYPFSNPKSKFGPVLYGMVASFLSFLIIPAFTLVGYTFRIRESAAEGKPVAPKFEDFGEMTKEGFYGLLAYLPLFGILFVSATLLSFLDLRPLIIVPYVLTAYFLPAVGVFHAVDRTIVDLYKKSEFKDFITSKAYFLATLKYIGMMLLVALGIMIGSIVTLGLIGLVVAPLLLYVRPCFWGHRYYEIVHENRQEVSPTTEF